MNGKAEVFFGSDRFELMAHCIGNFVFLLLLLDSLMVIFIIPSLLDGLLHFIMI